MRMGWTPWRFCWGCPEGLKLQEDDLAQAVDARYPEVKSVRVFKIGNPHSNAPIDIGNEVRHP